MIRIILALAATCGVALAQPATKAQSGVPDWMRGFNRSVSLVKKAFEIGDVDELRTQSYVLTRLAAQVSQWPGDDAWTAARIYCARMASELSLVVDDRLKGTARGERSADAGMREVAEAEKLCETGLRRLP